MEVLKTILPYLDAGDLASVALTCTRLSENVKHCSAGRCRDITRGLEALPVPVVGTQVSKSRRVYPT
jgi:hypothetical protein